jgi:hypothetical protein
VSQVSVGVDTKEWALGVRGRVGGAERTVCRSVLAATAHPPAVSAAVPAASAENAESGRAGHLFERGVQVV